MHRENAASPFRILLLGSAILLLLSVGAVPARSQEADPSPAPVLGTVAATQSPRATVQTFVQAMDTYATSLSKSGEPDAKALETALSTLNLSNVPFFVRSEAGRQAAIALKEVIDRSWKLDYESLPNLAKIEENPPRTFTLGTTGIVLKLVVNSENVGQYLFSSETVSRARELFEAVQEEPALRRQAENDLLVEELREEHFAWLPGWARADFAGLDAWQWLGLFLAIMAGLLLDAVVAVAFRLFKRFAFVVNEELRDHVVEQMRYPVAFLVAIYFWVASVFLLGISGTPQSVLYWLLRILGSVAWLWFFYRIGSVLGHMVSTSRFGKALDEPLRRLISRSFKIFILIITLLTIAQMNGINVASIIAGLGVGGLAVALAAKDTLANFFGSVMIMFDKPFRVGDWIKVGDQEGTVEDIGFRSTRIRTFYNSLISVPSSELAMKPIDNMGARTYRRQVLTIGVTYDTPPEKIEAFCEGIKNIILANPHTRKDYFHIVFNDFGASSLDLMLYFFVRTPDWSRELVERHNVMLEILRLAADLGVSFAFPTQTVHVDSITPPEPLPETPNFGKVELSEIPKAFSKNGKDARPSGSGLFTPPYETKT